MAETLTITCDRCGAPTAKEERTRVKWGREPERLDPVDLCAACRGWLLVLLKEKPRRSARVG